MKSTSRLLLPSTAAAAALALCASAPAASLLIDFQGGSNTQTGASAFVKSGSWTAPPDSAAENFLLGTDTITITAFAGESGGASYDRGAGTAGSDFNTFEFRDLLRDGLQRIREYNDGGDASNTALTISGLSTSTQYQVRIWTYDSGFANNTTFTYYNLTGTPTSFGSITNQTLTSGNASFPDRNAYSVSGTFTPSPAGTLSFGIDSDTTGQAPKISGLEIIVIPETSSALLLTGGMGFLLVRRPARR